MGMWEEVLAKGLWSRWSQAGTLSCHQKLADLRCVA